MSSIYRSLCSRQIPSRGLRVLSKLALHSFMSVLCRMPKRSRSVGRALLLGLLLPLLPSPVALADDWQVTRSNLTRASSTNSKIGAQKSR